MKKQMQTNDSTQRESKRKKKRTKRGWVVHMVLLLLGAGILCYAGLIGFVYYAETHVPEPAEYDSIIVLGAQVLATGEPSVQLRWRLDKALEMYRLSPCPVVVCGGQGEDEPAPEGQVMREILIAEGIPEEDVYADMTSVNTDENMNFAWMILAEIGRERPLVVTSDYHLPRALAMAKDMGLEPQGAGSPARNEFGFWMKNHMREALAWVKYWGIKYLGLPL